RATGVSTAGALRLAFTSSFSLSFIGRLDSQMSVEPLMSAAMPVPEPPPVTSMVRPWFSFMYVSAHRWPRMTIVSEPLTVMLVLAGGVGVCAALTLELLLVGDGSVRVHAMAASARTAKSEVERDMNGLLWISRIGR